MFYYDSQGLVITPPQDDNDVDSLLHCLCSCASGCCISMQFLLERIGLTRTNITGEEVSIQ